MFDRGYSDAELADARERLGRVIEKLELQLSDGRAWLLGEAYSLADIKWYSMVPGLPRMLPESCNPQATPCVSAWLGRMAERSAVQALEQFRPRPAPSPA